MSVPIRGSAARDWNQASSRRRASTSACSEAMRPLPASIRSRIASSSPTSLVKGRTVWVERSQTTIIPSSSPSRLSERSFRSESKSARRCIGSGIWIRSMKRTMRLFGRGSAAGAGGAVCTGASTAGIGCTLTAGKAVPRTSWKFVALMTFPPCRISKSSAFRPWTASPEGVVTTTSRLNNVSSVEAVTRGTWAGGCAAEKPARRKMARIRRAGFFIIPRWDAPLVPRGVVA